MMKRFGQQDFLRQMLGIKRAELVQFRDHFRRDALRLPVFRPAMHDAMPDRRQRPARDPLLNPIHQNAHRRRVIRRHYPPRKIVLRSRASYDKPAFRKTDPLHSALQHTAHLPVRFEQRKLDARRPAVDGENRALRTRTPRVDGMVRWVFG